MAILAPPNRFDLATALLAELPALTAEARSRLGISVKVQAAQIGIGADTLARFESGSNPSQSTILSVLRWLSER